MFLEAQARAGRAMDPDEFALGIVTENLYANDVIVRRLEGAIGSYGMKAEWSNAIKTGIWMSPTDLGELKALDLEHAISSLRLTNKAGKEIMSLKAMRKVLGEEEGMMDNLLDGLARHGADKDYIRRVKNALEFNWNGFWGTAAKRFGLTVDESEALQRMMAGAAKVRGLNPVEFMSQVFSPTILDGMEGSLGHLEGTVGILRAARAAGRKVSKRAARLSDPRARLAAKEGESTREDLVRQLSAVFSAHLDPSAKRALLMEFRPELRKTVLKGASRMDLKELDEMFNSLAKNELADRIIGYMDGKLPTHPFDEVVDEARGSATARAAADRYMLRQGATPQTGRRHYRLDGTDMEAHYEEGAKHYSALPAIEYDKTGRIPTARTLSKSGTDLKPRPAAVDDATYESYHSFAIDVRNQFDFMTLDKSKGGMGLKVIVSRTDPYTPDAAGRAAMKADIEKGQLKVFGGSADHPLMTNDQTVMFRAVHDVFGHAAEGFEFGPRGELNAAANHARMFSNEGRPAMLTETHGQTAWVNYSDDIVPGETRFVQLDDADPVADFERRYPFEAPESQQGWQGPDVPLEGVVKMHGQDAIGMHVDTAYAYTQRVGEGIRNLPPEVQKSILQPLADLFDEFPNLRVHHIDAVSFSSPLESITGVDDLTGMGYPHDAWALTWGADADESVIILNRDFYTRNNLQDWSPGATKNNEWTRQKDEFYHVNQTTGDEGYEARRTAFGTPYNVFADIRGVVQHEAGHAFDSSRRPYQYLKDSNGFPILNKRGQYQWYQEATPANKHYGEMMERFQKSDGALHLSEYSTTSTPDFAAELYALTVRSDLDMAALHPDLREIVEEFRQFLIDRGDWVPKPDGANAGKTVRELNAAKRGTVYAPQKAGLLPQPYIDDFVNRYVGRSKHIESNPDVARTAQQFGKWTEGVIANGLLKGEHGQFSDILGDIAGIPTGAATPYNFTEAATVNLATQAMVRKWDDAFRLQYFSQERSVLERSLNHPMFGLYPASYMWGKIMPELVRFIAAEPFGNKTGAMLYSLMDAQMSLALRRETDPYFDAHIEDLGHSQAMSFGGFLLPTLPWEVGAAAPSWMMSIAEQGLANKKRADAGEDTQGLSFIDPAVATAKKLAPLTTTLPWAGRAIDELAPADEETQ
jgi:hypothetical protein